MKLKSNEPTYYNDKLLCTHCLLISTQAQRKGTLNVSQKLLYGSRPNFVGSSLSTICSDYLFFKIFNFQSITNFFFVSSFR